MAAGKVYFQCSILVFTNLIHYNSLHNSNELNSIVQQTFKMLSTRPYSQNLYSVICLLKY